MRSQDKFNRVPKKVPKKAWETLVQGQVQQGSGKGSDEGCLGAKPNRVQPGSGEGSGEGRGTLVQSQVKFNRVSENVPVKVPESVPGGFGAKPGQVQQGSEEGSRRPWCKSKLGSTKVVEAVARSQVKFNRVSENVPVKVPAKVPVQRQVRFNRVPQTVPEKVWEALVQSRSCATGFRRRFRRRFGRLRRRAKPDSRTGGSGQGDFGAEPSEVQQRSGKGLEALGADRSGSRRRLERWVSQHVSKRFAKIKGCGCRGYHRALFWYRTMFVLQ